MASVHRRTWKLPSGEDREAWRVSYWVGGTKRFKQFPGKGRARRFAETVSTVRANEFAKIEAAKGPLLMQLAEEWLAACRRGRGERPPLEPATVAGYAAIMKHHVLPRLGHKRVGDCTKADVRDFRRYLLEGSGLSRNSAKRALTVLTILFGYAIEEGCITSDPSHRVRIRMSSRERPDVAIHSKADMTAILTAADRLCQSPNRQVRQTWERYRPLLQLLVYAGLRLSEARALERGGVNIPERSPRRIALAGAVWESPA